MVGGETVHENDDNNNNENSNSNESGNNHDDSAISFLWSGLKFGTFKVFLPQHVISPSIIQVVSCHKKGIKIMKLAT